MLYDDGDEEWVDLGAEQHQWVDRGKEATARAKAAGACAGGALQPAVTSKIGAVLKLLL